MNAYVDASALLRLVLREPGGLDDLRSFDALISSELIAVETLRTLDRLRLAGSLTTAEAAAHARLASEWVEALDLVLIRPLILARASQPLPVPLGTLDAIHLATALTWRDRSAAPIIVATHDAALGLAARSYGFDVVGTRRRQGNRSANARNPMAELDFGE